MLRDDITEIIKDNLADLLTLAETQKLLKELPEAYQKLLGDIVPSRITAGGIQRILQRLLAERVSIRDLPTILEAISDALAHTQSPLMITEHVRGVEPKADFVIAGGTDFLRVDPEYDMGITGALKIAHLGESLGLDVVTQEDGAAWLAFVRSLVARGLAGVKLVTSDAHPGLVDAIAHPAWRLLAALSNTLHAQPADPRGLRQDLQGRREIRRA